jgi:hypothetical protein
MLRKLLIDKEHVISLEFFFISLLVCFTSAVGHTKHTALPYGTTKSGADTKKSHYITITMMYRY